MDTFYYLSTCSTCKRILSELQLPASIELREIKSSPLTEGELQQLKNLAGSYESLFSKRAQLYKERDLKNKTLTETNFKDLLLEHYTFLKRPVLVLGSKIFIGNDKKTVAVAKEELKNL